MGDSGQRPLVIAHRGASGYLPEHSLVAKALAYGQGADYLEQDVVASRDGVAIVFHDLTLDAVTDVAGKFPGRARADGLHYVIDFEFSELQRLAIGPRLDSSGTPVYPDRFSRQGGSFPISSLDAELHFIRALNKSAGREVGIYPEIKDPLWHREHGIELGTLLLDVLDQHGYLQSDQRVFLQCFDAEELQRVAAQLGSKAPPMIQLLGRANAGLLKRLPDIAVYAQGIGPSLRMLLAGLDRASGRVPTDLVSRAHAAGLQVHPYTLRADDLPSGLADFEALLDILVRQLQVDGLFTDFPDRVRRYLGGA